MALTEKLFDSADTLATEFAQTLTDILKSGIETRGRASLVVSGGRTPAALFKTLSNTDLAWDKVDITLADERWVDEDHEASNAASVRKNLLQNKAAAANFVTPKTADADANDAIAEVENRISSFSQPFDALILGMGEDGIQRHCFPAQSRWQTA